MHRTFFLYWCRVSLWRNCVVPQVTRGIWYYQCWVHAVINLSVNNFTTNSRNIPGLFFYVRDSVHEASMHCISCQEFVISKYEGDMGPLSQVSPNYLYICGRAKSGYLCWIFKWIQFICSHQFLLLRYLKLKSFSIFKASCVITAKRMF